ncbi:MAG: ABC transporter ATP-binding protein [Spirochaetales bacterium]|nr:ABC transporter ATP-binding protein [Spirochaetales bacterium]
MALGAVEKAADTKSASPVIQFESVSFAYDRYPVLEDVSFTIRKGQFISVVGPNGGGKTTILKIILGLITPTTGRVSIFGTTPEKSRNRIGYVPQQIFFDPQFPASVLDVVLMGRLNSVFAGPYRRRDKEAAMEALSLVGLEGLASGSFPDLSGGQRQRVLIARGLATEGEILLFDEPTANIDRVTEKEVYSLLKRLKGGRTILLISHDLGVVPALSDNVLCVNRSLAIHPVGRLTGDKISSLYDSEVALVDHTVLKESGEGFRV